MGNGQGSLVVLYPLPICDLPRETVHISKNHSSQQNPQPKENKRRLLKENGQEGDGLTKDLLITQLKVRTYNKKSLPGSGN